MASSVSTDQKTHFSDYYRVLSQNGGGSLSLSSTAKIESNMSIPRPPTARHRSEQLIGRRRADLLFPPDVVRRQGATSTASL